MQAEGEEQAVSDKALDGKGGLRIAATGSPRQRSELGAAHACSRTLNRERLHVGKVIDLDKKSICLSALLSMVLRLPQAEIW